MSFWGKGTSFDPELFSLPDKCLDLSHSNHYFYLIFNHKKMIYDLNLLYLEAVAEEGVPLGTGKRICIVEDGIRCLTGLSLFILLQKKKILWGKGWPIYEEMEKL